MIKNPGKTIFSGRRRIVTRSAGFKSHPDSTGGNFRVFSAQAYSLLPQKPLEVIFTFPEYRTGDFIGFGGYFCTESNVKIEIHSNNVFDRINILSATRPDWGKFGSLATSGNNQLKTVRVTFTSDTKTLISFYDLFCGVIEHKYLTNARPELLKNMALFSPEANFYSLKGAASFNAEKEDKLDLIYLKSCNRCARFLPININDERKILSFSNHCVARRPCKHKGFGRLLNLENNEILQLEYGYQLECRFCKKFEVNAAHNPQRNAAQMKEDGARRRAFELLLTELYKGSPQLLYRIQTNGRELADDIWLKFQKKCFNCSTELASARSMHLDHTRPLALLWPLDETATCLCKDCNTAKRDRSPLDYYTEEKLVQLSNITKIALSELKHPTPNPTAIINLKERLDWFFNDFCKRDYLTKERDGKRPVDLLIKALQKALSRHPDGAPFNLVAEYRKRNGG